MRQDRRVALLLVAGLAALLARAPAASAEEYRLRVVSVHEQGFYAYLKAGELKDGVSGPGLDRLERSLDSRDFPNGALIGGRDPAPARESVARVWGGVPVRIEPAGESVLPDPLEGPASRRRLCVGAIFLLGKPLPDVPNPVLVRHGSPSAFPLKCCIIKPDVIKFRKPNGRHS